jgi:sugar phosphate isomerase/epimerase
MIDPLRDIRIGTMVEVSTPSQDPVSYTRQILPHGFESIQLTFWQSLGGRDLVRLAGELREVLAERDIPISAVGIYGNPLEGSALNRETLAGFEALIDHAHLFGTNLVTGFTGRVLGQPIPASLPRFKEIFGPLARRAADRGLRIAFETCAMDGTWQSGDFNIAHTPDAWEMMFDALPDENLGLEWEPCHQMLMLIDPVPQLRRWIPKIFHVHGKDATIRWDVVRRNGVFGKEPFAFHRTPGFGDSNWTGIISDLRQGGYKGHLTIEGWHDPVYRGALEMTGQVHALNHLRASRGGLHIPNPT